MHFLEAPPRFLFFTGKGGVGKTSLACATSIHLAEQGKRVLLVSTDPASNVGQVFGLSIGNHLTPIDAVPRLVALEIDPEAAAQAYRDRIIGPVRGVLPEEEVRGMEEQLSGACTTEIAAFDEFTGLLTDDDILSKFDHVIFDTAPTGHTIRLLQLPGAWNTYLAAGKGDASCLGPLAGLDKQKARYAEAVAALADAQRTRLVLVARAQPSALREVERTREELEHIGLGEQHLVINAVMPADEINQDALAAAIYHREQVALEETPEALKRLPRDEVPLKPFDLIGVPALRQLLTRAGAESSSERVDVPAIDLPTLGVLVDEIASGDHGLVMVMGKGGVGKTTIAAAIAVALAKRGLRVHLTTSDPAAHLKQTVIEDNDNLTVSRIDPRVEVERYRGEVMGSKGAKLDAQGRALLEEDLRSPCTEEIAVSQAFSRIVREGGKRFVIMDTAPTGHTLLLLDTTGAYHREMARQMQSTGLRYTTALMQLQDPKHTKVVIVTLAETTPVLEAANLQSDLNRADIHPWAWVINNSIAAAVSRGSITSPLLLQRARNELPKIEAVPQRHAVRYAVVPLLAQEPIGADRLLMLTKRAQP